MIKNAKYLSSTTAFLLFITFSSCQKNINKVSNLFTKLNGEQTNIKFSNPLKSISNANILKYNYFYNGPGIALGDINNDGLVDVFLVSNKGNNRLYLNKGNFKFDDITRESKLRSYISNYRWSTSASMVDINGDGFLDIYLCNSSNSDNTSLRMNKIYINKRDNTFEEKKSTYNVSGSGMSSKAIFFDYDLDGDLDLFIANYSLLPISEDYNISDRTIPEKKKNISRLIKGGGDVLLRNDNGRYYDVTNASGIYSSIIGYATGVCVSDLNGDSYPDIYVSNDSYEQDYMYINNADGTFSEKIDESTYHISKNSKSVDIGDINNDGRPDILVVGTLPSTDTRIKKQIIFESNAKIKEHDSLGFKKQYIQNTLQLNQPNGRFLEIAHSAGVAATDHSFSGLIFDMDNDGYKDIFITNGIYKTADLDFMSSYSDNVIQRVALAGSEENVKEVISKMKSYPASNFIFHNNGNNTFSDISSQQGFDKKSFSGATAYADFDNDGDLDIIVTDIEGDINIYKNNQEKYFDNNYIKLKFIGTSQNTFGIGATVKIFSGREILLYEHFPNRGFQSSMTFEPVIGLGNRGVDSLQVIWPNKKTEVIIAPKLNQTLHLVESKGNSPSTSISTPLQALLKLKTSLIEAPIEDHVDEFKNDKFAYRKLSNEGPTMTLADFNGDGIEDIFVGGPHDRPAKVYINNLDGWLEVSSSIFENDKIYEDNYSVAADFNKDGFVDIIVGSGGNWSSYKSNYKTRIYLGDGKGHFSKGVDILDENYNIGAIVTEDFDQDGDLDIFIGNRSIPNDYGINPEHFLLENKGDATFVDVTKEKAKDLQKIGMITAAVLVDLDGDSVNELVISCDWESPVILKNQNGILKTIDSNLSEYSGWWETVATADVNEDGKPDLIFGNRGTNGIYKPTESSPINLLIKDFDKDGTIERILYQNIEGKDKPLLLKDQMENLFPFIKTEKMSYENYSEMSVQSLLSNIGSGTIVKSVKECKSMVAINQGNLKFEMKALPEIAQWSVIRAILITDINGDGYQDILLGGNDDGYRIQFGNYDASNSSLLLGDGEGNFKPVSSLRSGLSINGQVRIILQASTSRDIFIGVNNQKPLIFEIN